MTSPAANRLALGCPPKCTCAWALTCAPRVGEGNAGLERVAVKRRCVDGQRPVRLGWRQAFGVAVVQHGMVEGAHAAGGVVFVDGLHEDRLVQAELARQRGQRVSLCTLEHRRHEAAHGLGVNDAVAHLAWLLRHQPAPDGVALGPEILALVIKRCASRLTMTPSDTQSTRVTMPPSYSGARASMATMWACVGSPMASAPCAIRSFSSVPWLKRVPRIKKLSAVHSPCAFCPQASRSHSRLDSKPPLASTQVLAVMRPAAVWAATKRPSSSSSFCTGVS